jgi:hypothetical protein
MAAASALLSSVGNLSLYQELRGVVLVNRLLADGMLVGGKYKHVDVRVLEFVRPLASRPLGPASEILTGSIHSPGFAGSPESRRTRGS